MNILTFDIEDWFHILDHAGTEGPNQWRKFPSRIEPGVKKILDFCDRLNLRATFFILGWVAEKAPDIISEIAHKGHEIGCHSYLHQLVYKQTPYEFEYDLVLSLDKIEAATGIRPKYYRAPGFSIKTSSIWAFDILIRNGIEIDASIFPAARAHGGLPDFPKGAPCVLETESGSQLKVFPMSFGKAFGRRIVFSGGGYFRLLPLSVLKFGFNRSDYVMTYFHPRDFDCEQPLIQELGPVRRFKSYVGISGAFSKLERICFSYDFVSIGDAERIVDWNDAERVPLFEVKGRRTWMKA